MTPAAARAPAEILEWTHEPSGLVAILVLDDTTLGPAAGGIRTREYRDRDAAREDAQRLARAMTIKCALANLAAGGGKCVVMDHPALDRPRAFAELGKRIESLGGRFRTAGDLGTTREDLEALSRETQYAHAEVPELAEAVGRGLRRSAEAAARFADLGSLTHRTALVQGAGAIGEAVAHALAQAGAKITLTDLDPQRASRVASSVGGQVVPPERAIDTPVDLFAPCAIGGVITPETATRLAAKILCGAANNILSEPRAAEVLRTRGIVHIPDVIASAGAVIEGIGRTVMALPDRTPLIDALADTVTAVLEEAKTTGRTTEQIATEIAERRIAAARGPARRH